MANIPRSPQLRKKNLQKSDPDITLELMPSILGRAGPKGLGRVNSRGWYQRNIHCPAHDDKKPSCSVKADGSLYCPLCREYWGQRDTAKLLRVELRKGDQKRYDFRPQEMGDKIPRRVVQRALVAVAVRLPKRLRGLMRLLISMSKRFGTCAMSQGNMAKSVLLARETVNRQLRELRELGWIQKLGHYVIGFNPELWHRGLEMRVCVFSPFVSQVGLDEFEKNHTMHLSHVLVPSELREIVTMVGYTARIQYDLDGL